MFWNFEISGIVIACCSVVHGSLLQYSLRPMKTSKHSDVAILLLREWGAVRSM
jgi:hypothetical protein